MNKESQNAKWKESLRDEYIKWICGFANAEGGTLFIGIDDDGEVVGTTDAVHNSYFRKQATKSKRVEERLRLV
jgi:predicted HTH transcriptional regulator